MKRYIASLLLLVLLLAGPASSQVSCSGVIAVGTEWETPFYVIDSRTAGPVVMITAGIHGNEPAGSRAAAQILNWKVTRGKLIILPRANQPGLEDNTRRMPGVSGEIADLNRNFPVLENDKPKCPMSTAIWTLVESQQPDWLIDLHEGINFARVSKSVGSSIIADHSPETKRYVRKMLDAVNNTIDEPVRKFMLKSAPVKGSVARAASELLGARSMIIETTSKDQPLSLRSRQHRIAVHRLLSDLDMVSSDVDTLVGAVSEKVQIRAAIYDGGGVGSKGPVALEKDLSTMSDIVTHRLGATEIGNGALEQFDVLIIPGGGASKQAEAIGTDGRKAIVDFIRDGGGFVGFCAGAYLASNNYTWSLKIIDADVIDRKHWKRGTGEVEIELTAEGRKLLGGKSNLVDIRYANGPILQAADDARIPDFKPWAIYRTEINKNDAPPGLMKDTPAIIAGQFGAGRVFCSSPHPEYTDGLESFVVNAIRWAAAKQHRIAGPDSGPHK